VLLGRRPEEHDDDDLRAFHLRLIEAAHDSCRGTWALCEATGWPDNPTCGQLLTWSWTADDRRSLVVVNHGDDPATAMIHPPWTDLAGRTWRLDDPLNGDTYQREGDEMATSGLYVALPPWGFHLLIWSPSDADT
jgi:hypothetical protein